MEREEHKALSKAINAELRHMQRWGGGLSYNIDSGGWADIRAVAAKHQVSASDIVRMVLIEGGMNSVIRYEIAVRKSPHPTRHTR